MKTRRGIYKMMGMLSAMISAAGILFSACPDPAFADPAVGSPTAADVAVIDPEKKCSLTIYKYDTTSAAEAGVQVNQAEQVYGEQMQTVQELLQDYTVEGVEFSYLYCGDVQTYVGGSEDKKEISLVYKVPGELCDILDLKSEDAYEMADRGAQQTGDGRYYSTAQIHEAWKTLLLNQTSGEESAGYDQEQNKLAKNILEDYLTQSTETVRMPLTNADGETTVANLKQGLYLVVETKVPENVTETVNPWFVTLPFTTDAGNTWKYDITCYPKNQTGEPTLDKLVRDSLEAKAGRKETYEEFSTASEGEVLDYIFVSKLPHIQSKATWLTEYTFSDFLSPGLTYRKDVKIAFYTSGEDAYANRLDHAVKVWDENTDDEAFYTHTYGRAADAAGRSAMTVSMTESGLKQINENYSDYWMVVFYTAAMHSDASVILGDSGNENQVTLLWRRTSNSWYDTLKDDCLVYTYGVNLEKQFSDDGGDPEKAKFLLQYQSDQAYVTARLEEQENGERVYYVTGRTANLAEATRFTPAQNGKCMIYGLRGDTYELTEEKTDIHYQLLSRGIGFEIQETERQGDVTLPAKAVVDGQEAMLQDGRLNLQVLNYRRVLLPETGGNSMLLFSMIGIGMVVLGCCILKKKTGNLS